MGISGINNFITKHHVNIMSIVDISQEIEDWIDKNDDIVPQILIDLRELPHVFMQNDEMGVILGGRFDQYNKAMLKFLEKFAETNAKLVFFAAGKKYTDDLEKFILKREEAYEHYTDLWDKIKDESNLQNLLDKSKRVYWSFGMTPSFNYNLDKVVRKYGDFHVNHVQHNQEIARYAKKHSDEVLAVITNDTDFMAFEGDFQFWRANGIDVDAMTCVRYCRRTLCDELDLNFHQIQMLSALGGSQFLPYPEIQHFLNTLDSSKNNPGKFGKIWNLTTYIKGKPFEMVENRAVFDLQQIACDVFGPDYTVTQMNSIAKCLATYDLNFDDEPNPRNPFLKLCKQENNFLYKLATDHIFNVKDVDYIDFRDYKTKSYADLIIPILMKMCGILYKDDVFCPIVRKICMKHGHDEPFKVTEETIIYPPMELPALSDLVFENGKHVSDEIRWSLLEWLLDFPGGFVKRLHNDNISTKLLAVIFTIKYLIQQKELTIKEANGILYAEHLLRVFQLSDNNNSTDTNKINPRMIQISHLYVKMYVLISHCLEICGLHNMTDIIRFDSPTFFKGIDFFHLIHTWNY